MLWKELKVKYPKLEIDVHPNSLHVIRGDNVSDMVLKILFDGDRMVVWRCIPRYNSDPEKIYAADPEFIAKIFDVMEGRRPVPKWS